MTTFDTRQLQQSESRAKLQAVVAAGEALGLFKLEKAHTFNGTEWSYATVKTPAGLCFNLSGGRWNKEGSITCNVTILIGEHSVQVTPRDVMGYKDETPEASATYTRSAEAIAKDLHKRVMNSPAGVCVATRMRERMDKLQTERKALRGHMATLEAMGFTFDRTDEKECHRAKGYAKGSASPHEVEVWDNGRIGFEVDTNISKLVAILGALK